MVGKAWGRNSFRFFPLNHQNLHLLSWFTPSSTIWKLNSAAELVSTLDQSGCQRISNVDPQDRGGNIYRREAEYTSRRLRAASGGKAKAS